MVNLVAVLLPESSVQPLTATQTPSGATVCVVLGLGVSTRCHHAAVRLYPGFPLHSSHWSRREQKFPIPRQRGQRGLITDYRARARQGKSEGLCLGVLFGAHRETAASLELARAMHEASWHTNRTCIGAG